MLLLCASCAATNTNPEQGTEQIRDYILIELALKRQADRTAYELIRKMIRSDLSSSNYAHLISLLKKRKHHDFRYELIQSWSDAYPQDQAALLALAKEDICQGNPQQVQSAGSAFRQIADITVFKSAISCLNVEAQQELVKELLAYNPDNAFLKEASCHLIDRANSADDAIKCFEDCAPLLDSKSVRVLALLYQSERQLERALEAFKQVVSIEPNDVSSRYELAGIYYDLSKFQSAIEELENLLTISPNNRNAQYLLAASYFATRDLENSRIWFERILVSQRFRNRAFYYLGMIAMELNQFEQAKDYLYSVKPSDDYLPAQLNYWRLIARDDLTLAIEGLYDLLDKSPDNRMTIKLAQIDMYDNAGEKLRATQELVSLADDYPYNLRLQVLRIHWLIDRGYIDRVTANLQASLSNLADDTKTKRLITSTLYHLFDQGYGTHAVSIVEQQKVFAPDTDQYLMLHGLAHAVAGSYATATTQLNKLLDKYPNRHDIKNALGYTYTLEGKHLPEAERLITAALNAVPDNAAYIDSMGWLRYKQGNLTAAEVLLVKANSYSNEPTIKAHLIEVYRAQRRTAEAEILLNEGLKLFPDSMRLKALQQQMLDEVQSTDG